MTCRRSRQRDSTAAGSLNLTRNAVDAMRGTLKKDLESRSRRSAARRRCEDHRRRSRPRGVLALGEHIFHPFVTTKREGLGVGLAISRTIVQSCGGSLTYRDNPAGGAVFAVELPSAGRRQ